jgi:hypothetical protein
MWAQGRHSRFLSKYFISFLPAIISQTPYSQLSSSSSNASTVGRFKPITSRDSVLSYCHCNQVCTLCSKMQILYMIFYSFKNDKATKECFKFNKHVEYMQEYIKLFWKCRTLVQHWAGRETGKKRCWLNENYILIPPGPINSYLIWNSNQMLVIL